MAVNAPLIVPNEMGPPLSEIPDKQQKSFKNALTKNLAERQDFQSISKMKIIPPLTLDNFKSPDALQNAYKDCVNKIMCFFPRGIRNNLTIAKTFTTIKGKNLQSLTITGPAQLQEHFEKATLSGIEMLGKTVFPYAERSGIDDPDSPYFPKRVNIKISNLPFICTEATLLQLMELPEEVQVIRLRRQTESTESGEFYDGEATLAIFVKDQETLENVKCWSHSIRTKKPVEWHEIPIKFHAPGLHFCNFCQQRGHDEDWCYKAKKHNEAKSRENRENIRKMIENEKLDASETIAEGSLPNKDPIIAEATQTSNLHSSELEHGNAPREDEPPAVDPTLNETPISADEEPIGNESCEKGRSEDLTSTQDPTSPPTNTKEKKKQKPKTPKKPKQKPK